MTAYYNEIDPYAAQWLRNLIAAGHIAPGDVDERDIRDVHPDDLTGYAQCHFFAGIGGWSYALRLAGWPDDRPVWTGSCPCQPFSAAGKGEAFNDERHLWPAWLPLIAKRCPSIVFGEQVEAAVGWGWLDTVFADLEQEGYACGAAVLPACSVGAPHIRDRVWFVANAHGRHAGTEGLQRGGQYGQQPEDARLACCMGDADGAGLPKRERNGRIQREALEPHPRQATKRAGCGLVDTEGEQAGISGCPRVAGSAHWIDAEWIECADGKWRAIEPGSSPLAHGIRARPSKIRAYGNAIVPQVAAEFIRACG